MTDAALTAVLVAATNGVTGLGTWYATRVNHAKLRSDEAQSLNKLLMDERSEREEEIRKLRVELRQIQCEREADLDRAHERADLDQQIRHEGASIIRNCLTLAGDLGLDWADIRARAQALDRLREIRRTMR